MPAFTTNQWAVVILVLVAGWLLGLMSRSGGGKWRRAYEEERNSHVALRRDYDEHLRKHDRVVSADPDFRPVSDRII